MIIRKVSIGGDYKSAMNYIVGQQVLNASYVIHHIQRTDKGSIVIYIEKDKEVFTWKEFHNTMPISIEYNIEFN